MAAPPLLEGGSQLTVACRTPAVAEAFCGAVGTLVTVNVDVKAEANGLPLASFTPVVSVTVYAPEASADAGVRVACVQGELQETVAATGVPGLDCGATLNVVVVIVAELMLCENVATTAVEAETPVAPFAGDMAVTVGGRSTVTQFERPDVPFFVEKAT
jgi:hypothetical protein